ncbi:MAG: hypothetical protein O4750_03070, partial [Trichodesmium sp. St18_bin3_1_1]|nr:hypothetical protein [Trichodesmium sp. St18_bin3_1_1]
MTYSETSEQYYISEDVKKRIQEAKYQKLKWLDLSWSELTRLPESITELSNLTRLYLSGNKLT